MFIGLLAIFCVNTSFTDSSANVRCIPQHQIEAIARCILPDILAFYESEKGRGNLQNGRSNIKKKPTCRISQIQKQHKHNS